MNRFDFLKPDYVKFPDKFKLDEDGKEMYLSDDSGYWKYRCCTSCDGEGYTYLPCKKFNFNDALIDEFVKNKLKQLQD